MPEALRKAPEAWGLLPARNGNRPRGTQSQMQRQGWKENASYTLNTIDRPAVCAGLSWEQRKARSIGYCEEQAPALNAECGGNKPAIPDMSHACDVIRDCGGTSPSLRQNGNGWESSAAVYSIGNGQVNEMATPAFEKAKTRNTRTMRKRYSVKMLPTR